MGSMSVMIYAKENADTKKRNEILRERKAQRLAADKDDEKADEQQVEKT